MEEKIVSIYKAMEAMDYCVKLESNINGTIMIVLYDLFDNKICDIAIVDNRLEFYDGDDAFKIKNNDVRTAVITMMNCASKYEAINGLLYV